MNNFWKNKRVLITGHTGFKGSWLTLLLSSKGAKLYGISKNKLSNTKKKSLFNICNINSLIKTDHIDICDYKSLYKKVNKIKPDIIFHLAAQSIISDSYEKPLETFYTNVLGTTNILECIKNIKQLKTAIIVSTDRSRREITNFNSKKNNKQKNLLSYDPYRVSKYASELIIESYCDSYFKNKKSIVTVTTGNIIGGGDWSKDRLIPGIIKAWISNNNILIRNPYNIGNWQYVLDSLNGYIGLAEHIHNKNLDYEIVNFESKVEKNTNVRQLINESLKYLNRKNFIKFKVSNNPKISKKNKFLQKGNRSKINFNFKPKYSFSKSIENTIKWYMKYYEGMCPLDLCKNEIEEYTKFRER